MAFWCIAESSVYTVAKKLDYKLCFFVGEKIRLNAVRNDPVVNGEVCILRGYLFRCQYCSYYFGIAFHTS